VVGILRAGGDTRFSMWLDAGTVWLVGIPLALLGAFVFKLPVYWVYLMVMAEEFTKYLVGLWRVLTRKWMNDLTDMAAV
jgi:Na+-driven multidrug efflux pump